MNKVIILIRHYVAQTIMSYEHNGASLSTFLPAATSMHKILR